MNKATELKNTNAIVESVLKIYPEARNSDNYLYYTVCHIIGKRKGIDIDTMTIPKFFLNINNWGFPKFETVRRTRQKLQATHKELRGSSDVEAQRMINQDIFKEYAMGVRGNA